MTRLLLLITALLTLTSCNEYAGLWNSTKSVFKPLSDQEAAVKLNYAYIQTNILQPHGCTDCHGNDGGVNLQSLDNIRAHSQDLLKVLDDKSMPKGSEYPALNDDELQVLYAWIKAGAPQGSDPLPAPSIPTYPPLPPDEAAQKLNYTYVRDNILIPKCVSCHGTSGHISLESLKSVQQNAKRILFATSSTAPSMPPFGPLKPGWDPKTQPVPDPIPPHREITENDKQVLYYWLTAGAPAGTVVNLSPVKPTFDDINAKIFQVRCMDCHNPSSKTGQHHPLTKEGLLNPSEDYVKAGDPEHSSLVLALEQSPDADGPMPPPEKGYMKLSASDLQAIKDWITSGAKD